MPEGLPASGAGPALPAAVPPHGGTGERARAWRQLADHLVASGRPAPALLAAVTAAELFDRLDDHAAARSCRAVAGELSGTAMTVLTVGAGADAPGVTPDEARALWLGAPADPVLAMIGWVERRGEVHVVRAVVPGTHRGRSTFRTLLHALPLEVPVRLELPARDRELIKATRRMGFAVTSPSGSPTGGGEADPHGGVVHRYVGGTARATRPAVA